MLYKCNMFMIKQNLSCAIINKPIPTLCLLFTDIKWHLSKAPVYNPYGKYTHSGLKANSDHDVNGSDWQCVLIIDYGSVLICNTLLLCYLKVEGLTGRGKRKIASFLNFLLICSCCFSWGLLSGSVACMVIAPPQSLASLRVYGSVALRMCSRSSMVLTGWFPGHSVQIFQFFATLASPQNCEMVNIQSPTLQKLWLRSGPNWCRSACPGAPYNILKFTICSPLRTHEGLV